MFYSVVKFFVRLALKIYCRKIIFSNRKFLQSEGPLLLACNHPNSFLDAIIIGSHFKKPVHFLARGDAFRKPVARKILSLLNVVPIYRLAEGREYLALNDATFLACRNILLNGGVILIFSEGLCENKWQLRPLKKGTARIALDAWQQPAIEDEFRVLPVSLNYSYFHGFNKVVVINFGRLINQSQLTPAYSEGEKIADFNAKLYDELSNGMLQSASYSQPIKLLLSNSFFGTTKARDLMKALKVKLQVLEKRVTVQNLNQRLRGTLSVTLSAKELVLQIMFIIVLLPFALVGFAIHLPIYLPLKNFVSIKTKNTVFYDSVLFGLLLIFYPVYFILLNVISLLLIRSVMIQLLIVAMPLFALISLLTKHYLNSAVNFFRLSNDERKVLQAILVK